MHPNEQPVVGRFFGIGEDVVASHPAEKDEAEQEKDEDGPPEETIFCSCPPSVPRPSLISVIALA